IIPDEIDRREIFRDKLIDQKVIFKKSLQESVADAPGISEYNASAVSPELYEIALESGKYSRFKTDKELPTGSYEKLYRKWIEKSVSKEIADKVFVFFEDRRILGLITVKKKNTHGEIGLLGIHPDAQGKGIGSILISAAENYVISEEGSLMEVATQYGNSPACRFYEKNGYSVKSIFNYYHIRKT
ncbi:MAG: GNAT family N-acetyltransferase, partial [Candidatus Delongbacteria bacterium]|nr:GNAT family N-acetyltransferase [Candidatus Delongbacteria bacterium]